jgi:ELWxxDGT repeat protein
LWRYNGTDAARVADINPGVGSSHPGGFVIFEGAVYFQADDGTHGYELWRCDGTNIVQVADINRNPIYESGGDRMSDSNPRNLTVVGAYLYFSAHDGDGNGLWRYDGTDAVLIGGGTVDSINELVVFQDTIYFDNDDGFSGRELWKVKVNPEPRMEISAPSSDVQLQLHDAITGTYVIEAADNLLNWYPVATNQAINGTIRFTDATAVNSPHRTYRAVIAP